MTVPLDAAKEVVIKAAVQMVYDGMSDAAWHRIKRAVLVMESCTAGSVETALPWPCSCGAVSLDQCSNQRCQLDNLRGLLRRVLAANIAQGCAANHPRIALIYDIQNSLGE